MSRNLWCLHWKIDHKIIKAPPWEDHLLPPGTRWEEDDVLRTPLAPLAPLRFVQEYYAGDY